MTGMYCVKCKKRSGDGKVSYRTTKNNRKQMVGKCSVCGTKKCQFVSGGKNKSIEGSALYLPGS